MKKILAALGAMIFIGLSAILSTGANITPFTGPNSGCNEASQLLACLNLLIQDLNGGGGVVSFGVGGTGSTISERSQLTPNPNIGGGLGQPLGPGTGVCVAGAAAECASANTPTTLNAQRGLVTFMTPIGVSSNSSTLMVLNSLITTTSVCQATLTGGGSGGTGSAGTPFLASLTPTVNTWVGTTSQGALLMTLGNAGVVPMNTNTYTISFWCQ